MSCKKKREHLSTASMAVFLSYQTAQRNMRRRQPNEASTPPQKKQYIFYCISNIANQTYIENLKLAPHSNINNILTPSDQSLLLFPVLLITNCVESLSNKYTDIKFSYNILSHPFSLLTVQHRKAAESISQNDTVGPLLIGLQHPLS